MMLFFAITLGAFGQTPDIASLTLKAKAGDTDAQFQLYQAYCKGEGVAKNTAEGLKWLGVAAKNNHLEAAAFYGTILLGGNQQAKINKNTAEGVKYLRKAADQKNMTAILILVQLYCSHMTGGDDLGVSKYLSYDDCIKYAKIGAEQGNEDMQTVLSNMPKVNLINQQEKELVAKYGQKAYDNIKKGNVYVGMPEGILTAYKTIEDDGNRYQMYKYNGPYRDKVGTYKQYIPTFGLQLANIVGQVFPRIVKVRNGKVTNVVY